MHPFVWAEQKPDQPAIVMAKTGAVTTYRELEDRSNQYAQLFRSIGLNAGDALAIFMDNHASYLELCWAAQRSGLYYVPVASRLQADEVAYILENSGAKAVFASPYVAEVAAKLPGLCPQISHWYAADQGIEGYASMEAARDAQPAERIGDESPGTDMMYSSGTTGRPKGVRFPITAETIDEVQPLTMLILGMYKIDGESIYLSPAPLYHAAPLRYCMTVQKAGGTVVVMEKFDPETYLQLIQDHKVTNTQVVPTMFVRLLKLPEEVRRAYDTSSLRACVHAAAPCPIPVKEQMIDWWGPIIFEYYAGTEGNGYTTLNSEEWLAHKGSVGRAIAGVLHILDDDGEELPPGEAGSIYFSDQQVQFTYHNDEEKTANAYNEKGWSTLGDVGYVDEDGYLYLTDRKHNMIISGGVNIYPQETENILITHDKVLDAAVFGIPNEDFGEEVKAVVQLKPGVGEEAGLEDELIAYCREHLSHIKCPKSVDVMEELPRAENGKLYKRVLRDKYWEGHQSKVI